MTTLAPAVPANEDVPTYHDRPALKPSLYGWTVALYIFVGGLAGGAQILATAADLLQLRDAGGVILGGRALALAGAIIGAGLLILDLHTKQRFYNMLRIFRPTSPMSIGTYVLIGFGFWSLVALVSQLFGPRWLTLAAGCLGAIAGWLMTSYTASLLAATSTPLWAAAPRLLAVRFAASAIASGAAALCLIGLALGSPPARALAAVAIATLAVELVAAIAAQIVYGRARVAGPLREAPWGALHLVAVGLLGDALAIALFLLGAALHGSGVYFLVASLLALAGSFIMRATILLAGNESAQRPRDYFRFAAASPRPGA
jgi:formate-dependent nitrite reductase membrane component NrfD